MRHRYVTARPRFRHLCTIQDLLFRDDSIRSLTPRPGLAALFPLAVYRAPAPPLPFIDETNLLDDATRPLVLYQHATVAVIRLVPDRALRSVRDEP